MVRQDPSKYELVDFVKVFKALAEPTRLRILRVLSTGEKCVCEIEAILDMLQPRISQHLRILKEAELIKERKQGWWSYYSLNSSYLHGILTEFQSKLDAGLDSWPDALEELSAIQGLESNTAVQSCRVPRPTRVTRSKTQPSGG